MTETVTVEIPPTRTRLSGIALVLAGLVPVSLAFLQLGWFDVQRYGETVSMQLMRVPGHPSMMPSGDTVYWLALISMALLGLGLVVRLVFLAITIWLGHPLVSRGLFRSVLKVAWLSPVRAHVHTLLVLALAIFIVVDKPGVSLGAVDVATADEVSRGLGGFVLIGGLVLVHVAIFVVSLGPLAATQLWEREPGAPRPARRERPMIKPPVPAAPRVDGDPFRSPPRADIESKLVKPPARPVEVPRADDPDAPPPKLLV